MRILKSLLAVRARTLLMMSIVFSAPAAIAPANASIIVSQAPLSSYSIIVGQSIHWSTTFTITSDVAAAPYLLDNFATELHVNWGDGSQKYIDLRTTTFSKPYPTSWTTPLLSAGHTYTAPGVYSAVFTAHSQPDLCSGPKANIGTSACRYFTKLNERFTATVTVKPVPTPPSWSLLIAGLGLIGPLVARRKKQRGTPRLVS